MVPAAVISMGKPRSKAPAASITARYPARFAWEERMSMLCARVVRGSSSIAAVSIPAAA